MQENENDEGEDLFGDNFEADYRHIDALDNYDSSQIDDERAYDAMNLEQKRKVDRLLNERDAAQGKAPGGRLFSSRIPRAFLPDFDGDGADDGFFGGDAGSRRVARHLGRFDSDSLANLSSEANVSALDSSLFSGVQDADVTADILTEAEATGYSLNEFIMIENFRRRLRRDFERFLKGFALSASSTDATSASTSNGIPVYVQKIRTMCMENRSSIEVSYMHITESNSFLAKLIANVPAETLKILDEAALNVTLHYFEDYHMIKSHVSVRIADLPSIDLLRELRFNHLNTLIRVSGVVTRRSGVFPQLQLVKYDCVKCGDVIGPFYQDFNNEIKLGACPACQSKGPFSVNVTQTLYQNYQRMTLQESPGSIPAGRLPRHKEVVLLGDLIDCARPGDEVEVTGVYRNNFSFSLNNMNGFPVFATIIEANHISKKEDEFAIFKLTEDDQKAIQKLSQDPLIARRIFKSIAPSIYGHDNIKTAIALALFGGQPKNISGKHQLRGDINLLLLGDPGTAKSQFLKYSEKVAPRAVYTTGQGASAVGLTAAVRKDPVTREWTLEGGALVLADKGVCLIDEFDKMTDRDRTSIHEAMEQQSISISKAGIVTSLQARCSVIAAANPVRGRYNSSMTFSQNVDLSDPILSRFDVLCVVKDVVDPVADETLARFVVGSHIKSHPAYDASQEEAMAAAVQNKQIDVEPLDQETLRKYLIYAKSRVHPVISAVDTDKISRVYSELRRESLASGSVPITVRHIESIVRCSEAHAKLHLRGYVKGEDIDFAIRVILESFIGAQKFSIMKQMRKSFARYMMFARDTFEVLYYMLSELYRDTCKYYHFKYANAPQNRPSVARIDVDELESKARSIGVHDLRAFLASRLLNANGFAYDAAQRVITKQINF